MFLLITPVMPYVLFNKVSTCIPKERCALTRFDEEGGYQKRLTLNVYERDAEVELNAFTAPINTNFIIPAYGCDREIIVGLSIESDVMHSISEWHVSSSHATVSWDIKAPKKFMQCGTNLNIARLRTGMATLSPSCIEEIVIESCDGFSDHTRDPKAREFAESLFLAHAHLANIIAQQDS